MAGIMFQIKTGLLSDSEKTYGIRMVHGKPYTVNYGHVLKNGKGMNWAEAILETTPALKFTPFIDEEQQPHDPCIHTEHPD